MTMTDGFRCPSCGFRIFSRRAAKCESCGAPLPVVALDAEDARIGQAGSAFVRRNAPRGSIGGDGGVGDGGCDGDGGGGD
jgi:hypothetical protein